MKLLLFSLQLIVLTGSAGRGEQEFCIVEKELRQCWFSTSCERPSRAHWAAIWHLRKETACSRRFTTIATLQLTFYWEAIALRAAIRDQQNGPQVATTARSANHCTPIVEMTTQYNHGLLYRWFCRRRFNDSNPIPARTHYNVYENLESKTTEVTRTSALPSFPFVFESLQTK